MTEYTYVTLKQIPKLKEAAAAWFHAKWGVPQEAYLECMEAYLNNETEYGWYLCLNNGRIVGGLGVIENDFHNRKDLSPNVCALYTEEDYRCQGIAGQLLEIVVKDCGACREFMTQLMPENYYAVEIMLDYENKKFVTLGDITSNWWI